MPDHNDFKEILKSIERIDGVKDCLLATMDGMPVGPIDPDSSILSAASAAALGSVGEVMKSLEYGSLEQLIVETDYGRVLMEEMGNEYALIVIADNNANIGMIRIMLKKALGECEQRITNKKQDTYSENKSFLPYNINEAVEGFEIIKR
ncbi:MAG TPA: hypothetical protein GX531_05625 [Methanothermobacter sp.]|nr:hypothetical protein [Methanothermobacter sp.]